MSLHKALTQMADEWEEGYGPNSDTHRVFGPQKVSIEFAVARMRDLLIEYPETETTEGNNDKRL